MVSLVHNMENYGGKPVNLEIKKLTPHLMVVTKRKEAGDIKSRK